MSITKENKAVVVHSLKRVYGLLSNPKRWVKGTAKKTLPDGTVAYCMTGTTACINPKYSGALNEQISKVLSAARHSSYVAGFNDAHTRTHGEVLVTIKKAITLTANTKV